MPRLILSSLFVAALLLTTACNDDNNGGGTGTGADNTGAIVTPSPTGATADPTATPEEDDNHGEEEALGNGEDVPFQTPDGQTIAGVLLSEPGPNQRLLVFVAENAGRYRDMYTSLVTPGVAVLVFSAEEDADVPTLASHIETAVRLARSRDYPLIYVAGEEHAGAAALLAATNVELEGVIGINAESEAVANELANVSTPKLLIGREGNEDLDAFETDAPDPKQIEVVNDPPEELPEDVAELIRVFMTQ